METTQTRAYTGCAPKNQHTRVHGDISERFPVATLEIRSRSRSIIPVTRASTHARGNECYFCQDYNFGAGNNGALGLTTTVGEDEQ